jgi:hypothetical protein
MNSELAYTRQEVFLAPLGKKIMISPTTTTTTTTSKQVGHDLPAKKQHIRK